MIQWKCGKRKGANGGSKRRRGGDLKPAERSVCAADPAEFKRVSCKTQARGAGRGRRGAFYARTPQISGLASGRAFPHAGRGRAKAAGGARGWQTVLPQVRQDLHRGSAYPHAGRGRAKAQGSAWVASRPAASKRTCTGGALIRMPVTSGKSRRGRVRRQAL